jgi:hypothetical protein
MFRSLDFKYQGREGKYQQENATPAEKIKYNQTSFGGQQSFRGTNFVLLSVCLLYVCVRARVRACMRDNIYNINKIEMGINKIEIGMEA